MLLLDRNSCHRRPCRPLCSPSFAQTADPGLYGFGELLDLPQIQSLRSTEHAPFVALLELFAYGTWLDYRAASSALPTLSEAQVVKLKQLTVASAAQGAQVVPYADLMAQLEIGTVRELENFLISSCMYGGVLQGSLDQQNGRQVRAGADRLGVAAMFCPSRSNPCVTTPSLPASPQTVRRRLRLQGLAAGQAARPDTDSPAMGGHLHGGLQRARWAAATEAAGI